MGGHSRKYYIYIQLMTSHHNHHRKDISIYQLMVSSHPQW